MVPVHDPVSKPTTQCTYHHIQCTLQHTATLCSLQPNIQCTSSAHTAAAITSLVHTLQQPLHLHCTHCSSHFIFSAHTTAAITSSVHTADVMILHYNTTLTPSSKAIYSGTKYYDTHIEFHSLFLDVSSTDV